MKLFAHGPRDIVDGEVALAVAGPGPRFAAAQRLASRYGLDTVAAFENALGRR